jgi:hypothetical protein
LLKKGSGIRIADAPTSFGKIGCSVEFESERSCQITFNTKLFPKSGLKYIEVRLPWKLKKISPASPNHLIAQENDSRGTRIRFSREVSSALLQLDD